MKKIISLFLFAMLSFSLFSCNKDESVLQDLKTKYPNSQISEKEGIYEVVSENIDFLSAEVKETYGESPMYICETLEQLLDSLNPETAVVIVGEKTGESKQYIPVNAETNCVDGLFYTHSKVKVKKAYYGDIADGDIITVCEYYAVFNDSESQRMLYDTYMPLSTEEGIYVLYKNESPSLFGETTYYDNSIYSVSVDYITNKATDADKEIWITKLQMDLYQKYVVNNDTALDREQEIKKNAEYNSKRGQGKADGSPTDKQLEKIDALIRKYGEKPKTDVK